MQARGLGSVSAPANLGLRGRSHPDQTTPSEPTSFVRSIRSLILADASSALTARCGEQDVQLGAFIAEAWRSSESDGSGQGRLHFPHPAVKEIPSAVSSVCVQTFTRHLR